MNYLTYYDTAYPCHYLLDVQPRTITLVTSVNDEQSGQPGEIIHPDFTGMSLKSFPAFTLGMEDIKNRTDAKDCCWWGIIDKLSDSSPHGVMNLTALSYAPRLPLSLAWFGRNFYAQIRFFLPYLTGDFTQADFYVSLRPGFKLAANIQVATTTTTRDAISQLKNEGMLEIALEGPDTAVADTPVTVNFQVTRRGYPIPCPVDVELESVGGYLPKPRIRTTASGEGQFRVIPLGLEPGETFKVKAGFRFFAGLGEKVIQVVEHI
jgi:hypothetical protein